MKKNQFKKAISTTLIVASSIGLFAIATSTLSTNSILSTNGIHVANAETLPDNTAKPSSSKITVQGEGIVTVKPDIAYISVGVSSKGKDAATAKNVNDTSMSNVIASLKAAGIDEKDIQTSNYYIYPQMDYRNGNDTIIGYVVNNNVDVTVNDLNSVGHILDKAIESGANTGGHINFSIKDSSEYYAKALVLALDNAESKAGVIANALNAKIDKPNEVAEISRGIISSSRAGGLQLEAAVKDSASIESGSLTIHATIEAVYNY